MVKSISDLFGVAPDEFIKARNELARTLKEAGDDDSERVATLRKPSIVVWTLNQLPRRHSEDLAELLEAGRALRDAMRNGDPTQVRTATQRRKSAVAGLLDRARAILQGAGHAAAPATIEKVSRSLYNAAVDEAASATLENGELTEEVESTTGLGDFELSVPSEEPLVSVKEQRAREHRAHLEQLAAEAEEHAIQLEKEADALERSATRARSEATRAREASNKARARADA